MDDAGGVGRYESVRDLLRDGQESTEGDRTICDHRVERLALE
jgi:hypothetical protein